MHEASLALAVLDIVQQEAQKHGASRIARIRLAVGPFIGLDWEIFADFFTQAAAGSVAEGAELEREPAPAKAVCRDCGQEFDLCHIRERCPGCGGDEFDCLGGRMLAIVDLLTAT